MQTLTHRFDPINHDMQISEPFSKKLRIIENFTDDSSTESGRIRNGRAVQFRKLTTDVTGNFGGLTDYSGDSRYVPRTTRKFFA